MELSFGRKEYRGVRTVGIVLGMMFLVSGLLKIEDGGSFCDSVRSFGLLPESFVPPVSIIIIVTEVVCGTLLMFGTRQKEVTAVLFVMMLIFTAAVVNALFAGGDQMCGCFGGRYSLQIDGWTVARNLVLIVLLAGLNRAGSGKGPV